MCLVPCAALSILFVTTSVMDECELLHDNHEKHCHYADFHRAELTVIIDSSANMRIIWDKRLLIDMVKPFPIIMDAGTATGSNYPQGIDTAHFIGHMIMTSPVNVVGIT